MFFAALLIIWTLLTILDKTDEAAWMPELMKLIAGSLVGVVGGFGIAKKH